MQRKKAALLGLLLLAPTTAFAQHSGTQAEQEACTPDVFRLCQEFIPDEGPIVACLKAKHAELSAACEPVMFPHTEAPATAAADAAAPPRKVHHRRKRKHRSRPET